MSNLLEKASILLTPTAYDDGKILSVKPEPILGNELVTNGDFATDSDWNKGTGTTISGGNANFVNANGVSLYQNIGTQSGFVKITFNVTDYTSGTLNVYSGGNQSVGTINVSANALGTYTAYINRSGGNVNIIFGSSDSFTGSIDNVSVKEQTDGDFQFTRNSSATRVNSQGLIEDMQILSSNLVSNGDFSQEGVEVSSDVNFDNPSNWTLTGQSTVSNGVAHILQDDTANTGVIANTTITNKTYRITGVVSDYVSGSVGFSSIGSTSPREAIPSQNGEFTIYYTSTRSTPSAWNIQRISSPCNLKIDNVSVKEVGQDWTTTLSDANNYVEITQGQARLKFLNTSPITSLETSFVMTAGKKYKLTVDVLTVTSGGIKVDGAGISETFNVAGITTRIINPTGTQPIRFYRATANVDITLNSVSLIEITDDTNLPRIDYSPYSGAGTCGHWLFEPQSTNLVLNSNSGFGSTNMNLVYNNATSPDGTQNAYKSTTTTASIAHVRTLNVTFANTSTFSVFLKYGNNQWYQILSAVKTGNFVNVDIQNGVFGTNGADTENLSIKDFGNGWYRVSGTFINAAATSTLRIYTGSSSSSSWASTSAPIGSYNYGYGFQVEASSFATSYIPTNGSTVTRLQDAAFGAGSSDLINSTEGVLYAEIASLADFNGSISINDATVSNRIELGFTSLSRAIIYMEVGGVLQVYERPAVSDITSFYKIAFKWKLNDFSLYINGNKVAASSSGVTPSANTFNNLSFNGFYSNNFFGKTKCLAVFKEALTDDELECLTSDETSFSSFNALALANNYTII